MKIHDMGETIPCHSCLKWVHCVSFW